MYTRYEATQRIRGLAQHWQESEPLDKVKTGEDLEEWCVAQGLLQVYFQAIEALEMDTPIVDIIKSLQSRRDIGATDPIQRLMDTWTNQGRNIAFTVCAEILLQVP